MERWLKMYREAFFFYGSAVGTIFGAWLLQFHDGGWWMVGGMALVFLGAGLWRLFRL